jgi:hypothetical protein
MNRVRLERSPVKELARSLTDSDLCIKFTVYNRNVPRLTYSNVNMKSFAAGLRRDTL